VVTSTHSANLCSQIDALPARISFGTTSFVVAPAAKGQPLSHELNVEDMERRKGLHSYVQEVAGSRELPMTFRTSTGWNAR